MFLIFSSVVLTVYSTYVSVLADCPVCRESEQEVWSRTGALELMKDACLGSVCWLSRRFCCLSDGRVCFSERSQSDSSSWMGARASRASCHKPQAGKRGFGLFFFTQHVFIEFFCFLFLEAGDRGNSEKERFKDNLSFLSRDSGLAVLGFF